MNFHSQHQNVEIKERSLNPEEKINNDCFTAVIYVNLQGLLKRSLPPTFPCWQQQLYPD